MDKRSAVSDQQKINNQAKALDDYHQRILNLQAMVNSRDAQLAAAAQRERELREALEPFAQAANDIANGTAHHFSGGLWFTDMASGLKAIVWTGGAAKHRQLSMVDLQRAARLLASADGMQGNKV